MSEGMHNDQSASRAVETSNESTPGGQQPPVRRLNVRRRALVVGLIAAVAYLAVAGGVANGLRCDFAPSEYPYHILNADAMIHGQLSLREEALEGYLRRAIPLARHSIEQQLRTTGQSLPDDTMQAVALRKAIHDLALVNGRLYAYWPPLSSILAIPWVLLFGPDASDRILNALFGAANVGLAYWMLHSVDRSGLRRISEPCCVALAVLLGFGTVHFYMSCGGWVWFAAGIMTTTAMLLSIAVIVARPDLPRTYALSGALFGAAILGRNTVILAVLFYVVVIWLRQRQSRYVAADRSSQTVRRFVVRTAAFSLPVILAVLVQLSYNYARFGSLFESGLGIQIHTGGAPRFVADYDQYGAFNLVFLPTNLKYYIWNLRLPFEDGRRTFDPEGNSMFLITPPLLFFFLIWRRWDGFTVALLCGSVPVVTSLLLYFATGYVQFGNRYLLDAMPLLLLLVATGMNGRLSLVSGVLIIAAVAMNTFGTLRFFPRQTASLAGWLTPGALTLGAVILMGVWSVSWLRSAWLREHIGCV